MKATFVLTLRNWSIGFGFPGGIAVAVLYLGPLTDEELQWFASQALPDEGWRWARSVARLLAGEPPRPWKARTP